MLAARRQLGLPVKSGGKEAYSHVDMAALWQAHAAQSGGDLTADPLTLERARRPAGAPPSRRPAGFVGCKPLLEGLSLALLCQAHHAASCAQWAFLSPLFDGWELSGWVPAPSALRATPAHHQRWPTDLGQVHRVAGSGALDGYWHAASRAWHGTRASLCLRSCMLPRRRPPLQVQRLLRLP